MVQGRGVTDWWTQGAHRLSALGGFARAQSAHGASGTAAPSSLPWQEPVLPVGKISFPNSLRQSSFPPGFLPMNHGNHAVPSSPSPASSLPLPKAPFPASFPEKTPPATVPQALSRSPEDSCSNCEMPLQLVDPAPFIPHGFNRIMIPGRCTMSRVIVGRQPRRNSDLSIAIIVPMPNHQVSFTGIRNVLDDFLRDHMHVRFRSIQPCPFDQAYVRFENCYDCDRLIDGSPHVFGNVQVSFIPHDRS